MMRGDLNHHGMRGWPRVKEEKGMESDDLLYSRNAHPAKPLGQTIGTSQEI